jgi:hypothetical protein
MTREQLRDLLADTADLDFVCRNLLGRRPWIFDSDEKYHTWRETLASGLNLQTRNIVVVGSAATGFCLSPLKPGRPFRHLNNPVGASDIDIAFIDDALFTQGWNIILSFDRTRQLRLVEDAREKLRVDIYWGLVANRSIPKNTDSSRFLLTALAVAAESHLFEGM